MSTSAAGRPVAGAERYPLVALGLLASLVELPFYLVVALAPDVERSLGLALSSVVGLLVFSWLAAAAIALPLARLVGRRPRRAALALTGGGLVAVGGYVVGLGNGGAVFLAAVLLGFARACVGVAHGPLLMDLYRPERRVTVLAYHRALQELGRMLAVVLVAVALNLLDTTWRGAFLLVGGVGCVVVALAGLLRDTGRGSWERGGGDTALRTMESVRRILRLPSSRALLAAAAVVGMVQILLVSYTALYLDADFDLTRSERGVFFAVSALVTAGCLVVFGRRAQGVYERDPGELAGETAIVCGISAVALLLAGLIPVSAVAFVMLAVASAAVACASVGLTMLLLGILPSELRVPGAALQTVFLYGAGGLGGSILFAGVDEGAGAAGSVAALVIPAFIAMLVVRGVRATAAADHKRALQEGIEFEELAAARARGDRMPLLTCRGIDLHYGSMQVLFGVDLDVQDGEMLALLGTNGAGKSTLLRAISGLALPSLGSVRLAGENITYVDPPRRVAAGICSIEGGKGVFPPLTVTDNLRMYGYSHGRRRAQVERGIEATYSAFPRLAERRNQRASTLSGGEQQMLALGKALILRPRLLLIDELSLGLAPIVVTELLEMVRVINQGGTAVLLVEQSVTTALDLVSHAYFMEKGEIRFDGPASLLLDRADLLRSVFLEGTAVKGTPLSETELVSAR